MTTHPFHSTEENSIISLLIDFPELYPPINRFLTPEIFENIPAKYVITQIARDYEQFSVVPSRKLLRARIAKQLTTEDPYEDILGLVEAESDPREIPMLRDSLHSWTEKKTYDLIYSEEALAAQQRGDYAFLQKIFDEASKIRFVGQQGFWFFDQIDELFVENVIEHVSTGFSTLDAMLNEGGPSPGEVVIWMASTGVGKSIMLCCQAVISVLNGHNVYLATFELSTLKTALRIAANLFHVNLKEIMGNKDKIKKNIKARRAGGKLGDLVIYEYPPGEHSVDTIYASLDGLKKIRGWKPKVVILDYLELMISRHASSNSEDYGRQKSVATEVRGLAKNENVVIHTATQTNRSGVKTNNQGPGNHDAEGGNQRPNAGMNHLINLDQTAESFGKNMPVDYVITINQSHDQYNRPDPKADLFIAKNRNGPKFQMITVDISYDKMKFKEIS